MKETLVKFEVTYTPPRLQEAGQLMARLDLGINRIVAPQTEVWSWVTTSEVTKSYLKKMEKVIRMAIEEAPSVLGEKFIIDSIKLVTK